MKNGSVPRRLEEDLHRINFSKASPDTILKILEALNAEVDEAVSQKRFPTLDGALRRLGPSSSMVQ